MGMGMGSSVFCTMSALRLSPVVSPHPSDASKQPQPKVFSRPQMEVVVTQQHQSTSTARLQPYYSSEGDKEHDRLRCLNLPSIHNIHSRNPLIWQYCGCLSLHTCHQKCHLLRQTRTTATSLRALSLPAPRNTTTSPRLSTNILHHGNWL